MKILKLIIMTLGIYSLWSCNFQKDDKNSISGIKHVIIIGFDGLSPDGIEKATTPNFDRIIKEGSYSFHARAVLPTSSSTNWASMIMGAGPEQHGITSNSWEKNNFVLPAVVTSEDFLFPTIFNLINKQIKNAEIGAIYQWDGFGRLFEKDAVDYDVNGKTEDETADLACQYIENKKPTFAFIHFDNVDHAGHEFGWGTKEYYKAVEKSDKLLEQVFNSIKKSGIADKTLVIICSDHGGTGKGHGGESLAEIEVPFILWGKAVKKNYKLKYPIYQYDNAATVAFVLGLKTPIAWIGKSVKDAFVGYEVKDNYPIIERLKAPTILPEAMLYKTAGGLFDDETFINIKNPNNKGEIHYTTDGTMPINDSKIFIDSFKVKHNTVLKSAVFINGKINSLVSEAFFRIKRKDKPKPVSYEIFYLNSLSGVPFLGNQIPDAKGTCFEITSDEIKKKLIKENTAVRFKTKIIIDKEDTYGFYTKSDDGSILKINNKVVVNNDGNHGVKEKGGMIVLKPGIYPLEVIWFNGGGGSWLDVYYQTASIPKQILPTSLFK